MLSIIDVALYSTALPVILGGLVYFNSNPYRNKLFLLYILILTVNQLILSSLRIVGLENIWFVNTKSIILTAILTFYFLQSKVKPLVLITSVLSFVILQTIANSFLGWHSFNKLTYLSNNIIIVLLALYDTFQIVANSHQSNIIRLPRFWASIGVLFYFSTTTLIFAALDIGILNQNFDVYKLYVSVQPILVIIANLLYSMAFITQWKTKTSIS